MNTPTPPSHFPRLLLHVSIFRASQGSPTISVEQLRIPLLKPVNLLSTRRMARPRIKGRLRAAAAVLSVASATIAVAAASCCRKKRTRQAKHTRRALVRPLSRNPTAWQQLLACGRAGDFITAINFPLSVVLTRILPAFEVERARCRLGSPYRRSDSGRGRRPQLKSVDMVGLALWYLKSSGSAQSMRPAFGLVPSSLNALAKPFARSIVESSEGSK